ncbi:MAG: antibiotic biosynthesis monooxygenase [bacterium]|nr:antibiotic biosynthesis monooxygenase [bacterium]
MFVQVISMKAPAESNTRLRRLVSEEYLPALRTRPGFVAAHLLEQVDDLDNTILLVYWDNQAALENLNSTGVLSGSVESIAARLPGLHIQRQSYIVGVTVEANMAQAATI